MSPVIFTLPERNREESKAEIVLTERVSVVSSSDSIVSELLLAFSTEMQVTTESAGSSITFEYVVFVVRSDGKDICEERVAETNSKCMRDFIY